MMMINMKKIISLFLGLIENPSVARKKSKEKKSCLINAIPSISLTPDPFQSYEFIPFLCRIKYNGSSFYPSDPKLAFGTWQQKQDYSITNFDFWLSACLDCEGTDEPHTLPQTIWFQFYQPRKSELRKECSRKKWQQWSHMQVLFNALEILKSLQLIATIKRNSLFSFCNCNGLIMDCWIHYL